MDTEEEERIRRLVEELDRLTDRTGARVRLEQYGGGPCESRIVANRAGYLRFGIELLKGGLMPQEPDEAGRSSLDIDLKYLVADDSAIGSDEFLRDENFRGDPPPKRAAATLIGIALGVGCIAVLLFAVIGAFTMFRWF